MSSKEERRYLLWHPESECLSEERGLEGERALATGEVEDVTGIRRYEILFAGRKTK